MSVEDGIDRRVRMGGATRSRGILGGSRTIGDWVGMFAGLLLAVAPLAGGQIALWPVLGALAGAVGSVGVFTPWPGMRDRSAFRWGMWWALHWARRRRARSVFALARDGQSLPPQVLDTLKALTTPQGAAAVRHASPGRKTFYSVAWEMLASSAGFDSDYLLGVDQEKYGALQAALHRSEPRVQGLQQVAHVGAYDMADHVHWIAPRIPKDTNQALIDSYIDLLDKGSVQTDQTRTWMVARIKDTSAVRAEVDEDVDGQTLSLMAVDEVIATIEQQAAARGMRLRVLDPDRLAAVVRGMQDPDHPLDKATGMSWESAWAPWESWHPTFMVVHGAKRRWWTRTAVIPASEVAAGLLPADFLWPLIGSISPTLIRTVSTHVDLVDAESARSKILNGAAIDQAAFDEVMGRIGDDGSAAAQLGLSEQHLVDLRKGTPHEGAAWAATVTIQARSRGELEAATTAIRNAAEEASVGKLQFVDGWHDGAFCIGLPLGHGMGSTK